MSQATILDWECDKNKPEIRYWPKIMDFLGYCPYRQAHTFGESLWLHRTHRGLSMKEVAGIVKCDPGSLSRWERGERMPRGKWKERLVEYFGIDTR